MPYFPPNKITTQKQKEEIKNSSMFADFEEIPFWKPEIGENRIRILPPWDNKGEWFKDTWQHWIGNKPFTCRGMIKDDCHLCAKAVENPELKAKRRVLFNIIDLKNPGQGVQVWSVGTLTAKPIFDYDDNQDYGDITNPETGHDIVINRTGKGKHDTRYTIMASPKKTRISDFQWLEELYDLDNLYPIASNQDMIQALSAVNSATDFVPESLEQELPQENITVPISNTVEQLKSQLRRGRPTAIRPTGGKM